MDILIEIIGYIGMAVVVTSFLFKNIKWVRIVNICGSALSATYAAMFMILNKNTQQLPTLILNVALIIINSIMLITLIRNSKKVAK